MLFIYLWWKFNNSLANVENPILNVFSLYISVDVYIFFFFLFSFFFYFYNTLLCWLRSGKTNAIYLRKVRGPYYYSSGGE